MLNHTSFASPLHKPEFTECLVCGHTLGQESRDLGWMLCHDCRICSTCKDPLNVRDAKYCLKRYLELLQTDEPPSYRHMDIIHPKCEVLRHQPSLNPSEYDYLNLIRLSVIPDLELSLVSNENVAMNMSARLVADMDFEQLSLHLKMLQACEAQVRIAILQHPKYRKDALKERESKHFDKARKEAATSSRPVTKSADDSEEVTLGVFMSQHGLTERSTAKKIFSQARKTIESLTKLGVPEELARENVMADLIKTGKVAK